MRAFKAKDIVPMSKILDLLKISFEYTEKMTKEQIGIELAKSVFTGIWKADKEIFGFIASMKGVKAEVVEEYSLTELKDTIEEFKNQPDLKDFFTSVSNYKG